LRVADIENHVGAEPDHQRQDEWDPQARVREPEDEGPGEGRQYGHDADRHNSCVHVRVAGPLEDAAGAAVDELVTVQLVSKRDRPEIEHHQQSEMHSRRSRHRSTGDHRHQVADAHQGDRHEKQHVHVRLREPVERQLEHVEADVLAEGRVDLAERDPMQEELDGRPAARHQAAHCEGDKQSDCDQAPEDRPADVRDLHRIGGLGGGPRGWLAEGAAADRPAAHVAVDVEAIEQVVQRETTKLSLGDEATGEPDVGAQEEEGDQEPADETEDLRAEPGPEDVREADAAEPDRVGREADRHGEERQQHQQHDDDDAEDDPATANVELRDVARRAPESHASGTAAPAAALEDRMWAIVVAIRIARIGFL
jgi:hypothetical protein